MTDDDADAEFDPANRRRVLKALGASALVGGLAGCSDDGGGDGDGDGGADGSDGEDGGDGSDGEDGGDGDDEDGTTVEEDPIPEWDPLAADVWPMRRFGAGQSASHPAATPPEPPLSIEWTVTGDFERSPQDVVVGRDQVVAAGDVVRAYEKSSGEMAWTYEVDSFGDLLLSDRTVFVSDDDAETLSAVDTATGDELWTTETTGSVTEPVVHDGALYGHASINAVAYDVETGDQLWAEETRNFDGTLAVADGTVYSSTNDNGDYVVLARDAGSGEEQWRSDPFEDEVPLPSKMSVDDDTLYTVSGDGWVAAFDRDSGSRQWLTNAYTEDEIRSSGNDPEQPVVVGEDHVFLGGFHVHALSKSDGSEVWSEGFINENRYISRYVDGTVYNLYDPGIIAYDAADGTELWTYEHPDESWCVDEMAVTDGRFYVAGPCGDDELFVLESE